MERDGQREEVLQHCQQVSPSLQSNLMVETWPNGPGKMASSCGGPFQVENIDEIDFKKLAPEVDFSTKHDHSKWAVSYAPSGRSRAGSVENIVCIGDINRDQSYKTFCGLIV